MSIDMKDRRPDDFSGAQDGGLNVGDTADNHGDYTIGGDSENELSSIRLQAREVERWVDDNPSAVRYVEGYALARASSGAMVTGWELVSQIRHHDFVDVHGRTTTFSNTGLAWFMRLLVKRHPELNGHVEFRRSKFDKLLGDDGGAGGHAGVMVEA